MADNMSIDKKEPIREGSEDSMDLNSPTPEAETGAPQENATQQKRKGGRKPVCSTCDTPQNLILLLMNARFMPHLRNVNNATVRRRQPSVNAERNISSS